MNKYEIIIFWSDDDAAYVADVPELPGCMAHGASYAAKIGETDDLVMACLLAIRMLMLLQSYHADLNSYLKDHTDNIIEPFPFIAMMR